MRQTAFAVATMAAALLAGDPARAQSRGALIMEGAYDRPASNLGFCGPCMPLWYVGAAPNTQVDFTIEDPFPSAAPVVQSAKADPFGVALYQFKPSGQGEVRLTASSGRYRVRPLGCVPPIGPPHECPPPPTSPQRVVEKEPVSIPFDEKLGTPARVLLHQYKELPEAHWEAVVGRAVYAAKPAPQARVGKLGLRPGLYRVQFVDKEKHVLAVTLVRVDARP